MTLIVKKTRNRKKTYKSKRRDFKIRSRGKSKHRKRSHVTTTRVKKRKTRRNLKGGFDSPTVDKLPTDDELPTDGESSTVVESSTDGESSTVVESSTVEDTTISECISEESREITTKSIPNYIFESIKFVFKQQCIDGNKSLVRRMQCTNNIHSGQDHHYIDSGKIINVKKTDGVDSNCVGGEYLTSMIKNVTIKNYTGYNYTVCKVNKMYYKIKNNDHVHLKPVQFQSGYIFTKRIDYIEAITVNCLVDPIVVEKRGKERWLFIYKIDATKIYYYFCNVNKLNKIQTFIIMNLDEFFESPKKIKETISLNLMTVKGKKTSVIFEETEFKVFIKQLNDVCSNFLRIYQKLTAEIK